MRPGPCPSLAQADILLLRGERLTSLWCVELVTEIIWTPTLLEAKEPREQAALASVKRREGLHGGGEKNQTHSKHPVIWILGWLSRDATGTP